MIETLQVYKCEICGNIVEILHAGGGKLVCCGTPMELLEDNTVDAATEKHVPVVKRVDNGIEVTVGSVDHPMEETHFIEWIQVISQGNIQRVFLKPGDEPRAFFKGDFDQITVKEYCNLHGLWRS